METDEQITVQLAQRAEALRVLAAKVQDESSRDAMRDWACAYDRLRSALLIWGNSLSVPRKQHRMRSEAMDRHLRETVQYRALIADIQHLINETQAWGKLFDDETRFLKELERITRRRFAQSRPFVQVQSSHWETT